MNRQTFKDVVADKRSAFINDVEDDEDDEAELGRMKVQSVEGEEDGAQESVNITLYSPPPVTSTHPFISHIHCSISSKCSSHK